MKMPIYCKKWRIFIEKIFSLFFNFIFDFLLLTNMSLLLTITFFPLAHIKGMEVIEEYPVSLSPIFAEYKPLRVRVLKENKLKVMNIFGCGT